jgi:hypothetical protein
LITLISRRRFSENWEEVGITPLRNPDMREILTLEEMKVRFPSEWVLVNEPQLGERLEDLAREVLLHSLDRDEVVRKVAELRPREFVIEFAGPGHEHVLS